MLLNGLGRPRAAAPALFCAAWLGTLGAWGKDAPDAPNEASLFDRANLVAWCIVPYDARRRGPEARAEMLTRMGIFQLAYDWRAEHIPTFDEELETLKRWGIKLKAFWFPAELNAEAQAILDALKRHDIRTELWVSMHGGEIACPPEEQRARVEAHVAALRPIVDAAAALGCKVGLYNHGGWFGEPENQLAILRELKADNVGLVYNLHHGHGHLDRFESLLEAMRPHLLCLNLNGMVKGGDETDNKILPLGAGAEDLRLLRAIRDSGYRGPIGILGHTMDDAEDTLLDNLDGLEWLVPQLDGAPPAGPRPPLRVSKDDPASGARIRDRLVEDPVRRAALPEYQVIPAADPETLTPAIEPPPAYYRTWERSHGDPHNTRYARLDQITRENVHRLKVAWEYRSGDGDGNVQCNPIVVDGVLYGPTSGDHMVALDAATGRELWRFKPGGKPAFRGLTYWRGTEEHPPRLLFNADQHLWALDPKTGQPVCGFGDGGKVETGEARVAGAVYRNVFVLPLYLKDVAGYDVLTGERLWIFHTIPTGDEYGSDTWDGPEDGANCWGGMALDEARGIAYVSTGSPKPNFAGNSHRGQNLFANCVIALDALTGKRLWHFQEIRHDIWDLDIPAPPNLVTIDFAGRRVDAVAQVTKVGNTLLLDRLTGKPLFPFRMRRAPVSKLPGERTWPYQPDLELPEPFARQEFTSEDVTDRSPEARADILQRIENANRGWYVPFEENKPTVLYGWHGGAEWTGAAFDPESGRLYVTSNNVPWIVTVFRLDEATRDPDAPPSRGELLYREHCAFCHGEDRIGIGMNAPLHGLNRRFSEEEVRRLIKEGKNQMPPTPEEVTDDDIQAMLDFLFLRDLPPDAHRKDGDEKPLRYTFNGYPRLVDCDGYPGCRPPWGTLNCIDLKTGRLVWQVPIGTHPEVERPDDGPTGRENFGGATVTAGGLVFCAGTSDNRIRAFDADTGEVLWEHALPFGGYAPPTVYEAGDRQYVAIPATGGGKLGPPMGDAYIAFALD